MAETTDSYLIQVGADVGGALEGLKAVSNAVGGISSAIGRVAFDFLSRGVDEASKSQQAVTKLETALKNAALQADNASTSQGKWVTATVGVGAASQKTQDKIETLTARVHDLSDKLATAKHPTESMRVELEHAQQQLDKLVTSAGGATRQVTYFQQAVSDVVPKPTEKALLDLADAMERTTTYSRTTTIEAESMALKFQNIGANIFPDVISGAADMAAMMGGDLTSNVNILGKALENPAAGMDTLRRYGVILTDQQKEQIKTFSKNNDTLSAQKIILSQVADMFGGQAAAAAQTFAGQQEMLNNQVGELARSIGEMLLPFLSQLVNIARSVVDALENASPAFKTLALAGALVAAAMSPAAAGILAIAAPIGIVVAAVAGIGAAFEANFGGIRDIVSGAYHALKPALDDISSALGTFASTLGQDKTYTTVTRTVQNKRMSGRFTDTSLDEAGSSFNVTEQVVSGTKTLGDRLKDAITAAWPKFQAGLEGIIDQAAAWLTGALPRLATLISNALQVSPDVGQFLALAAAMAPVVIVGGMLAKTVFGIAGSFLAAAGSIAPFIAPVAIIAGMIAAYLTNFGGFRDFIDDLGQRLRALSPAAVVAAVGVGALAAAFVALGAPLLLVVAPFLVVGGLVLAYKENWGGFATTIDNITSAFGRLATGIKTTVIGAFLQAQKTAIELKGILSSLVGDKGGVQEAAAQVAAIDVQIGALTPPAKPTGLQRHDDRAPGTSASAANLPNAQTVTVAGQSVVIQGSAGAITGNADPALAGKLLGGGGGGGKGGLQAMQKFSLGGAGGAGGGEESNLATGIDAATTAMQANSAALTTWQANWKTAVGTITELVTSTFGSGGVFFQAETDVETIFTKMTAQFPKISAAFTAAFGNVSGEITKPFRDAVIAIGKILMAAAAASPFFAGLGSAGAALISIAGARADGGPVAAGLSYLVGERGPELFTPSTSGMISPGAGGGGGMSIVINGGLHLNGVQDPEGLYEAIKQVASSKNMTLGQPMGQ